MKKKLKFWIIPVALVMVFVCFALSLQGIQTQFKKEGQHQLEQALRRAAVACYAAEGAYPPTLQYLTEHYGIQIDTQRYQVFYEVYGENIMPEITVLEKTYGN